jgi:hypothetical protein
MAGPFASAAGDFTGAVSSLFGGIASKSKAGMYKIEAKADLLKGEGARLEGEAYGRAHDLALVNKQFTEESTAIQEAQAGRAAFMSMGGTRAAIGGSGLSEDSATDVLRASAQQGALERAVLQKQGVITEESYQEEADVYTKMQQASGIAVAGSKLASQEHMMAADAEETAATGQFIGAGIKAVAGVAALAAAPFTGGTSLAALGALAGDALIPGNWGEQS